MLPSFNYCLICGSPTRYKFSKVFIEHPFDEFTATYNSVDYDECSNCGFSSCTTIRKLPFQEWMALNHKVHEYLENPMMPKRGNQPPYLEQATFLKILLFERLISLTKAIDYAAGLGTLSNILAKYFDIKELQPYDPFFGLANTELEVEKNKYSLVVNSAMFEHIVWRKDLEAVNDLVADDGCIFLHTVICETIPSNPDWFYYRLPVHTAFHTNKSMSILMDQWNYECSVYCPSAKSWLLMKKFDQEIEQRINRVNQLFQSNYLIFKRGFVDYWKGF